MRSQWLARLFPLLMAMAAMLAMVAAAVHWVNAVGLSLVGW